MKVSMLIVDDQLDSRFAILGRVKLLFSDVETNDLNLKTASTIDELYSLVRSEQFQVILLDRDLGVDSNDEMIDAIEHIESILEITPKSRIFIHTSYEDFALANKARDYGAHGFLTKNQSKENQEHNDKMIKQAVKDAGLEIEFERIKAVRESKASGSYVSKSDSMRKVEAKLKSLAEINTTVLITGETGLGKTYTAKRLHHLTNEYLQEGDRTFLYKDINTIPKTLQVSELFGHEKGSFTGANERKMGLFELAAGGTLFLDEIGDASPELQGTLLNVIEEKSFRRLGGKQDLKLNARLMFATNKDLEDLVSRGEFRRDLYARICAIEIEMPALKDRKEDIPYICAVLCDKINKENGKKLSYGEFPGTLKQHFCETIFPENIRGIRNDLIRLAAYCSIKRNGKTDYSSWRSILNPSNKKARSIGNGISQKTLDSIVQELAHYVSSPYGPGLAEAMDLLEYKAIEHTMEEHKDKKSNQQAEILKLKPSTFNSKRYKLFKKEFNG